MKIRVCCVSAVLALASISGFGANLIDNGGFEAPVVAMNNVTPTNSIPSWSILPTPGTSSTLMLSNVYVEGVAGNGDGLWFETPFGQQHLDLTGPGNVAGGGITQDVFVNAGVTYVFGFSVGNLGFGGNTSYCTVAKVGGLCPNPSVNFVDFYGEAAAIKLVVGTTDLGTFSNAGVAGDPMLGYRGVNWEQNVKAYWTASTTGMVAVTFTHANGNDNYAGLDNVSMQAIPEPATLAMMGCGLLALGVVRMRARKN